MKKLKLTQFYTKIILKILFIHPIIYDDIFDYLLYILIKHYCSKTKYLNKTEKIIFLQDFSYQISMYF